MRGKVTVRRVRKVILQSAGGKEGLECAREGKSLKGAEGDLAERGREGRQRFEVCGAPSRTELTLYLT